MSRTYHMQFKILLGTVCVLWGGWTASADSSRPGTDSAITWQYQATGEQDYFAVALRGQRINKQIEGNHHVVILVDTSASQKGEHRKRTLDVLRQTLSQMSDRHQVQIFAIDVQATPLNDDFAAADSLDIESAYSTLQRRIPLGASDLYQGLSVAMDALAPQSTRSIVYFGDGMSAAGIIPPDEMRDLVQRLQKTQTPVHSFAVGPKTDLQLLGSLAQFSGGTVMVDGAVQTSEDSKLIATQFIQAVDIPVEYPASIDFGDSTARIFPKSALPLRSDRETIYIGQGAIPSHVKVHMQGDATQQFVVDAGAASSDNKFLAPLWKRAQFSEGLNVPFAGTSLLEIAQSDFQHHVQQLVALGGQALDARDFQAADEIGLVLNELDPTNKGVEKLRQNRDKLQLKLVKQLAQNDASEETADDEAPTPPTPAGDDDLIQRQMEMIEIKTERLRVEVGNTIDDARRLLNDQPEAARDLVKRTLGVVVTSTDIEPVMREQLVKRLNNLAVDIDNRMLINEQEQIHRNERQAQLEAQNNLVRELHVDEERLEQLIDRVRALLNEGYHGNPNAFEEAEAVSRVAQDDRPADGVSAAALFNSEAAGQLDKSNRMRSLRADKWLATLYQAELSHVPFPDEPPVLWPPAEVWRALTERRRKWQSVDLKKFSAAEERIFEALDAPTEIDFNEIPLTDVMTFIGEQHGITIIVDTDALEEEGLASDDPITRSLNGVSLRSALRIILKPLTLSYIIEDEVMKITTEIIADETLSTRVYPVGDLVIPIIQLGSGFGGGGGGLGMGGGGMGGMGGGMGGMGMGGMGGGMGMGGMGGGMFSVPSPVERDAQNRALRNNRPVDKNAKNPPIQVRDQDLKQLLNRIEKRETSQTQVTSGQAMAQINDDLSVSPKKKLRLAR